MQLRLTGKAPSIIVLIVIPLFVGICMYVYAYLLFNISTIYSNSNYVILISLRAVQACYLLVIAYGLYPIVIGSERFSKYNYDNIANNYEFAKKCLFVGLPVLVILITVSRLLTYFQLDYYLLSHLFTLYDASFAILAASITTVLGSLLRIVAYTAKAEFRYYLARGYIRISSRKQSSFDKIKYLFLSLDSYNKFIIRKTKLGIKNIDRIYSDIMHADTKKNDEMIKAIGEHLDMRGMDLGIYLATVYKVTDKEPFFAKESLAQRLKTVSAFLAAAIPIVVSIIQLFTKGV